VIPCLVLPHVLQNYLDTILRQDIIAVKRAIPHRTISIAVHHVECTIPARFHKTDVMKVHQVLRILLCVRVA